LLIYFGLSLAIAQTWQLQQNFYSEDIAQGNQFGSKMKMDGDFAIISALGDGTADAVQTGSVYIFKKQNDGTWQQHQKLQPIDLADFDRFGISLAIADDFVFVGSDYNDTDVNSENPLPSAGAVYVYKKNNDEQYNFHQKLVANDRAAFDWFGISIDYDNNQLIVGAPGADYNSYEENYLEAAGAAYLFTLATNGFFEQSHKITANVRGELNQFGHNVTIYNNDFIVSAPFVMQMNQYRTKLYSFHREDDNSINQLQLLTEFSWYGNNLYNAPILLEGNYLYVGIATGFANMDVQGIVQVLKKNEQNLYENHQVIWSESDFSSGEFFGNSLSLNNNKLIVGAFFNNIPPPGPDLISQVGAAYVFEKENDMWIQNAIIENPQPVAYDYFGYHVAINEANDILISTPFKKQNIIDEDTLHNAGIVYHYTKDTEVSVFEATALSNNTDLLFPNPSKNGLVYLQIDEFEQIDELRITNIQGRKLKTVSSPQNNQIIHIPNNFKGLYVASLIKNDKVVQSFKGLVIQ